MRARVRCAQRTLHAGLPPAAAAGDKWVATLWIRERPYEEGRPGPPAAGGSARAADLNF